MERTTKPVDQFLASLPDGVREVMTALDATLAPVFVDLERALWEGVFYGGTTQRIVGYGVYEYRGRSGASGEWFVAGIAAQKAHYTVYITGAEDGVGLLQANAARLGKVKVGSGSFTLRKLEDVNLDVLAELATRARDLMAASAS